MMDMKLETDKSMDVEINDLLLSSHKTIVIGKKAIISDLHLGIEQSMPGSIPRLQIEDIIERVKQISEIYGIRELIIAGDMKHEFSKNMPYEWDDIRQFMEELNFLKIKVVRGNHDNYLPKILSEYGIKVEPYLKVDEWVVVHGHGFYDELKDSKKIIIGHEHPSLKLRASFSIYSYPCFLFCNSEKLNRKVVVLPAFSSMVSGSDVITAESFLSDFTNDFRDEEIDVYVVEDEIYGLGSLNKLKSVLEYF